MSTAAGSGVPAGSSTDGEPRPGIRVNQLGYLPDGPKRATLVCAAPEPRPHPFEVRERGGTVVYQGRSEPAAEVPDPTSGLPVHVLDFTGLAAEGHGYTVRVGDAASHPFALSSGGYERLARDAASFFYAQRSGIEIRDDVLPGYGRRAGHAGVPPNQGDTAVGYWSGPDAEKLYPGWAGDAVLDVSGGWYDAGDHGKYVVNGGIAVDQLLSAYERCRRDPTLFADGALAVPEHGNGVPDLLDEARWELEWLLRMQVPDGQPYAGLAFHKLHDDAWTSLPLDPADDPRKRVLHRPSTAAALNLAAAAAHGARLWRPYDPDFAGRLLAAARTAYTAAHRHPRLYAPVEAVAFGGGPYDDEDVSDEFYWAASELYLTTGEGAYLTDVLASPWHTGDAFDVNGFDWGHVAALGRLDLARVPSGLPDRDRVRASVLAAAGTLLDVAARQPWDQPYAPADGRWAWGSNGLVLNNIVVLATAFDLSGDAPYRVGALRGLDYLLGRNAWGISYVTGYGTVYAHHQHSRHFAATLDPSSPPPPPGSLAGGPNTVSVDLPEHAPLAGRPPQLAYADDISSFATNEVAINWNSALVWAAAFAAQPLGSR